MKITASVDSRLGERNLERGKTYDVQEPEAKHLVRAGLARLSKDATKESTAKAASVDTPPNHKPGDEPSPSTARKAGK